MKCPICNHDIAPAWKPLMTQALNNAQADVLTTTLPAVAGRPPKTVIVRAFWQVCQNDQCRQILVQIIRTEQSSAGTLPTTGAWFAVPKKEGLPTVDTLVTDPLRTDYLEAYTILEDSPKMSSVLSRRILADLLKDYASKDNFSLAARINGFIEDPKHPSRLKENLHYLREMGDFGAHTQTDGQQEIIPVTKDEAEWTLKVIADLFDYFIVAPKKDEDMRNAFAMKIADAGRRPIS